MIEITLLLDTGNSARISQRILKSSPRKDAGIHLVRLPNSQRPRSNKSAQNGQVTTLRSLLTGLNRDLSTIVTGKYKKEMNRPVQWTAHSRVDICPSGERLRT